jgi:DNA polymerase-3 subunit beta
MKLTADKTALQKALTALGSIVQKREVVPVYAHVMLSATSGRLRISATNGEIEARTEIEADVSEPGECLAPGGNLTELVKRFKADVSLELDGGSLRAKSGRAKSTLPVLPVDQFPAFDTFEGSTVNVHASDLRRLLGEVAFAQDDNDTRHYLCGVYLVGSGEALEAVATNGAHLARATMPHSDAFEGVIIGSKAVTELQKLCERAECDLAITFDQGRMSVDGGGERMTFKLIDGTFPDYQRVIPRNNPNVARVNVKDARDAIGLAVAISDDKVRAVKLQISGEGVFVTGRGADGRDATDEVACELEGDGMEGGYNAKYLLNVLSALDSERAEMRFNTGAEPLLITPEGDDGCEYVVMGMRV